MTQRRRRKAVNQLTMYFPSAFTHVSENEAEGEEDMSLRFYTPAKDWRSAFPLGNGR
jgi:hypothetical protein